jgi:hypothetical protein
MNHHNILLKDDYEYYQRCVQRFMNLQESQSPIIFVNIQPVISFADFEKSREHIIECIQNFDNFLYTTYCGTQTQTPTPTPRITGLYFIMIQDPPNTEEPHQTHSNESIQYECMKNTNSRIHLVFVNRDFIDAGETFMGNCQYEREYIEYIIRGYVLI